MKQAIVFTDLDGSLLNHHDYSFEAALPCIETLQANGIAVIPNTSKTASEIQLICQQIGLSDGFICENGAAVYWPKTGLRVNDSDVIDAGHYWRKAFVPERQHWLDILKQVPAQYQSCFKGFSELGVEGIMEATGLPADNAKLSSQREFNEPLLWLGTEQQKQDFIRYMEQQGATVLQGGRFLHIGGNCNKATAMQWLTTMYSNDTQQYQTIALGDSGNDIAMLEAADCAVVIKAPGKPYPNINTQAPIIHTQAEAPVGWSEGMDQALQALDIVLYNH